MKEYMETYEPRKPGVVEIANHRIRAWIGDAQPRLGATLWIGDQMGRIVRLLENRAVEAIVFDSAKISVGDAVRVSDEIAQWPSPKKGCNLLKDLTFEPGELGEAATGSDEREPLATGIDAIDRWTPLVRHGVNLVFDATPDTTSFDRLVRAVSPTDLVGATESDHDLTIEAEIRWTSPDEASVARDIAARWAARKEGATLVLDSDVNIALDPLTERAGARTIFVRIAVGSGLEAIAETLDVGQADAQLVLRADGTIDFSRSFSRLGDGSRATALAEVAELKERRSLFGDDELELEQIELLERVELAEQALIR